MRKLFAVPIVLLLGFSTGFAEPHSIVDIEAQGQQSGTITDYLEANVANPMPQGLCYEHGAASTETTGGTMTSGQFTCLSALLAQTGLDKTLAEAGPYTLFAPTDEAFKRLADTMTSDDFTNLLNNNEELTKILTYHVLPEQRTLSDLFVETADNQVSKASVEKTDVTLTFAGADEDKTNTTITFAGSDAKVLDGQMVVDNGVIIPIDHVLTPPAGM